jgi:hypothetical protein
MIIKRTYTFSERVRVLGLATPEVKASLDRLCAATRLQQVEYEVSGESLRLAGQAHLLEIELPSDAGLPEGLTAPVGRSLHVELQRLDSAEPEARRWCAGVLATEGLLMVALPPDAARPAAEKKAAMGFRAR